MNTIAPQLNDLGMNCADRNALLRLTSRQNLDDLSFRFTYTGLGVSVVFYRDDHLQAEDGRWCSVQEIHHVLPLSDAQNVTDRMSRVRTLTRILSNE